MEKLQQWRRKQEGKMGWILLVGTVGGAAAGGALGSAVTGGSTIGTIGGAAAGGYIGNKMGDEYNRRNK
jgi:outer membrane lipoprotein SlyB